MADELVVMRNGLGGPNAADERGCTNSSRQSARCPQVNGDSTWAVNPLNDSVDSLANYLVHFAEEFFRLSAVRCRLDVPALVPQIPITTQQRHHLLLAVKEACNNVVRHSGATEVWLRLRVTEREFAVTVEDKGRGFDPATVPADHDGLVNMRQRMEDLGGRLELVSRLGEGTRVRLVAPLNRPSFGHVH